MRGVNLEVAKGEFCCLLGPSGCGKSTLLKAIAGFEQPSQGGIILDGADITCMPPQKRNVGLVFQHYALFPHLTVYGNIAYGLKRHKHQAAEIKRKVEQILETIGLSGYGGRRIHELSGGQQQRVALGRILVLSPKLLLLDEPLSNLDAGLRFHMRAEIREIQTRLQVAAILVTHDREEAMSMADRIAVMQEGRIAQMGTPQDLYNQPVSAFVAGIIGDVNQFTGSIEQGRLHIQGQILSLPDEAAMQSGPVKALVRPEKIRLEPQRPGGMNGPVKSQSFLGDHYQYQVEMQAQGQEPQIINVTAPADAGLFQVGEVVCIDIPAADIHLYPAEAERQ